MHSVTVRLLFGRRPARFLLGLGGLFLAFAGEAQACAICFSGMVVTPGQKLDSADQAVLAVPADGEQFRIIAVVKGDLSVGDIITEPGLSAQLTEPVMSLDGLTAGSKVAGPSGKPLLLVRNEVAERWTSVGAIGAEYAGWLRRLAATDRSGDARPASTWPATTSTWSYLTDAEWLDRVAIVAPKLESDEPLAAAIAYGELARAPYWALRTLRPQLDVQRIATLLDDPKLASRRSTSRLLLGIAGGPDDAMRLEQRIEEAGKSRDATDLAAMLAADLELRGPARVAWLEQTYFADRQRTLPEIQGALLALSVHGETDAAVPRKRVIEAYRFFIRERKQMAGFVALELARWKAWEATADFVEIIRSHSVKDPAGEFAIINYLQESPEAIAKAVLASDSAIGAN
jgi:hypothetical protein